MVEKVEAKIKNLASLYECTGYRDTSKISYLPIGKPLLDIINLELLKKS